MPPTVKYITDPRELRRLDIYREPFYGTGRGPVSTVYDTSDLSRSWDVQLTSDGLRFVDGPPSDVEDTEKGEILSAAGRDFRSRPSKKRRAQRAGANTC